MQSPYVFIICSKPHMCTYCPEQFVVMTSLKPYDDNVEIGDHMITAGRLNSL